MVDTWTDSATQSDQLCSDLVKILKYFFIHMFLNIGCL